MGLFGRNDPTDVELQQLNAEYDALRAGSSERIQRMADYREENQRTRDPNLEYDTADLRDYGRKADGTGERRRHRIPLPLGKAVTVKHAYRIGGRLPDVIVDQRDETPQERHRSDSMEKIVWAIMRASRAETTLSGAAMHASELGSACLDLYFDIKKQMPIFRVIDPAGVVEVQGVDDPHDFERIYRFWDRPLNSVVAMYRDKLFRGEPIAVNGITPLYMQGGTEMVRIVQLSDREKRVRFVTGEKSVVGLWEEHHGYGFVPYVVIPNIGPYEDVWGWADYEFIRSLVHYIGNLFSREADVVRSVSGGAVIEKGTGQTPETIKRLLAIGGVVPSKRDGSVEPIEAPEMPSFEQSHAERALQMFKMLGFAPDAAWGEPGSFSGSDRGLQLQPLLEYTAMKQVNWQAGLARLFGYAFRMIEQKMAGSAKYRGAIPGAGNRRSPFVLLIGPNEPPMSETVDGMGGEIEQIELPRTPEELFDGDHEVRFVWQNRVDPDDPGYVTSEVAKFSQGVQSLETTLERLGFQAPEDEMRRIENESKRFPWINQGLVSLLMAQLRGNAQGTGGGAPFDQAQAASGAMDQLNQPQGGGSPADANISQLPGAPGVPYGGA